MRRPSLPDTKSKKELIKKLKIRFPDIKDTQQNKLLAELRQTVNLFTRLATEPQLQVAVKERKVKGKRKPQKSRFYKLDLVEYISINDQELTPHK